jgi:sugar lactone lactonase YvrE
MNSKARLALAPTLLVAALVFAPGARADADDRGGSEERAKAVNIVIDGFIRPESTLHDTRRDVYLVSNITNGPRDEDNSGFVSRVSPKGTVVELKWIAGGVNGVTLNAPKGMTIANDILYVADIDRLRKFDAASGDPIGSIFFPGATFLNDVASDRHGNVYVTDIGFTTVPQFGESGTDAIYKVSARDDRVSVIASGNSLLNHPNGIVVLPNGNLKVATYDPFRGTKELFTIDRRGFKSDVFTLPTGLLDGVVAVHGGFLVSSWADFGSATVKPGKIYFVAHDGTASEVASGFENPSDIGYDHKRNRLLIPELADPDNRGTVTIRTLRLR